MINHTLTLSFLTTPPGVHTPCGSQMTLSDVKYSNPFGGRMELYKMSSLNSK